MKKDEMIKLVGIKPSGHLAKTNLQNLMNVWEKSQYISSWNDDDCWIWLGNKNGNGYGQFKKFGQVIRLHKFSYEFFKGKVPNGLEIDHLCRKRECFNPNHLEVVTHKENVRRGKTGILQKSRTHCPQGHELIEENLVKKISYRRCKICKNEIDRKYYRRKENEKN